VTSDEAEGALREVNALLAGSALHLAPADRDYAALLGSTGHRDNPRAQHSHWLDLVSSSGELVSRGYASGNTWEQAAHNGALRFREEQTEGPARRWRRSVDRRMAFRRSGAERRPWARIAFTVLLAGWLVASVVALVERRWSVATSALLVLALLSSGRLIAHARRRGAIEPEE
jgi:hypothetical protein